MSEENQNPEATQVPPDQQPPQDPPADNPSPEVTQVAPASQDQPEASHPFVDERTGRAFATEIELKKFQKRQNPPRFTREHVATERVQIINEARPLRRRIQKLGISTTELEKAIDNALKAVDNL